MKCEKCGHIQEPKCLQCGKECAGKYCSGACKKRHYRAKPVPQGDTKPRLVPRGDAIVYASVPSRDAMACDSIPRGDIVATKRKAVTESNAPFTSPAKREDQPAKSWRNIAPAGSLLKK